MRRSADGGSAPPPDRTRAGTAEPTWTALGTAGAPGTLGVDPAGRIVTGRTGWSLNWEVEAGTRRYRPAGESTLHQRRVGTEGAAPVGLETVLRAGDGEVSQTVYVCLPPGAAAGSLGVLEVRNETSAPVAVTLVLGPGDLRRSDGLWRLQIGAGGALANGSPALWWERPPAAITVTADAGQGISDSGAGTAGPTAAAAVAGQLPAGELPQRVRSRRGTAGATMTWPVTHGTALRVLLPLDGVDAKPTPLESLPTLAQVGRGWDAHAARGLRVAGLAHHRVGEVAAAAVRRLLALATDVPDGLDGPFSPPERALLAVALATAGFGHRAAEVASVRAARRPDTVARLAVRELARVSAPWGTGPAEMVAAMTSSAGPAGAWASERSGDDPVCGAAFLLGLRDVLVQEREGCLDLLPGADAGGPVGLSRRDVRVAPGACGAGAPATDPAGAAVARPPVEVHRLGTRWGLLSFALRWHDATPALLWELVPPRSRLEAWAAALAGTGHPDRAEVPPPRLTIGVLAPDWSTDQLAGETLLRP